MTSIHFDDRSGIFTEVLNAFIALLKAGGDDIVALEAQLATMFFALQLLRACLTFGFRSAIGDSIGTVVGGAIWYEVARNAVELVTGWMQFMGSIGATVAGGGSQNAVVMDDPSKIMGVGLKGIRAIYQAMEGMSILTTAAMLLFMSVISWLLVIVFILLGAITVLTTVKAYMNALMGIALMPFAIEPSTRWIAQTGISMTMEAGVSLGTMSIVIGVGYGVLQRVASVTAEPDLRFGVNLLAAAVLIVVLAASAAFSASRSSGVSAMIGAVAKLVR